MNTNTEYTPGPWRVNQRSFQDTDGHIKVVRDRDGYWIASARVWQDEPGEATQNARLIAAAPALLEALAALLHFAPDKNGFYATSGGSDWVQRFKLAADSARAAIAQATGKED